MKPIQTLLAASAITLGALSFATHAQAFCGFYVAKADGDLFNDASKVVLARKDDRTVVTMTNNYDGDPSEFAMVIPVSTAITRDQVHIADMEAVNALDAFSAPRLVEYYDPNPCQRQLGYGGVGEDVIVVTGAKRVRGYGVTIEDSFAVGEYDIQILSADQSDGLVRWLDENNYKLPDGAEQILGSYIKQDMKFFVAKVNLKAKDKAGTDFLRPISIAYESPKFMLPIRLGTLNARGQQDLLVLALTEAGKVETTNYRMHKIPTDKKVPAYLKDTKGKFGEFYKSMFDRAVMRAGGAGVFLEYYWDIGACDPCSAAPPTAPQLMELGAYWIDEDEISNWRGFKKEVQKADADDLENTFEESFFYPYSGSDVSITRLHIRYDAKSFPQDLKFHVTGEDEDSYFQGRYVMTHPYGENYVRDQDGYKQLEFLSCKAADYVRGVKKNQRQEASILADLTGWPRQEIWQDMQDNGDVPYAPYTKFKLRDRLLDKADDASWWRKIWPSEDE